LKIYGDKNNHVQKLEGQRFLAKETYLERETSCVEAILDNHHFVIFPKNINQKITAYKPTKPQNAKNR